jgi:hypothetical protein
MSKTGKSKSKGKGKGGRPKGTANIERPTAVAVHARCPRCGGTRHHSQPGASPIVHKIGGISTVTGQPYTHIVWRNVVCECGQHFRTREETNHDPRDTPV